MWTLLIYKLRKNICIKNQRLSNVGILDFDVNYSPIFIEVIFASKRFYVEKEFIKNASRYGNITIKNDKIKLEVCFEEHDENK